ncbi:MAG: glycosyltransferase [Bacteroidales bacterium]|nr:glycosyltransferase [Bacteroidales bacterium]
MKISIITATYNSEKTLRNTLENILGQTYQDYESIIVDGASKDGTMDLVREFEPRFQGRMKWISEPDKGIYDAMNKGIRMASGDVVGLLNSDDFYTSNDVLETIAKTFEGSDIDACYGDIHYVNDNDLEKCVRYYSSAKFTPKRMMYGYIPAHPSFYCRKEVYQKYGLFDTSFKIAADFEQLLRLIYVEKIKTEYIPKDFVTMRTGGASNASISSRIAIMKEHLRGFKKNGIRNNCFRLSLRYFSKLLEYKF